jgi:hypothetical protein
VVKAAKLERHQDVSCPILRQMGCDSSTAADLKIDSAFTRDIDQNSAHQTLVKTLCEIGHSIGVTMIAEGVRNDAECNTLRKLYRARGEHPRAPGELSEVLAPPERAAQVPAMCDFALGVLG